MITSDDFDHDPNVQGARKYFSRMEAMDFALIKRSDISLFDSRFRTARDIDLVTPRKLKGKELLMRTRGWWTVEPTLVADIVEKYGKLMVGENGELMVELKNDDKAAELSTCLTKNFNDQIIIAP